MSRVRRPPFGEPFRRRAILLLSALFGLSIGWRLSRRPAGGYGAPRETIMITNCRGARARRAITTTISTTSSGRRPPGASARAAGPASPLCRPTPIRITPPRSITTTRSTPKRRRTWSTIRPGSAPARSPSIRRSASFTCRSAPARRSNMALASVARASPGRASPDRPQGVLAGLDAAAGNAASPSRFAEAHGRRHGEPLGARALYLFKGDKDSMFRIHGTNEPDTIGQAVSSGCIRNAQRRRDRSLPARQQGARVVVR